MSSTWIFLRCNHRSMPEAKSTGVFWCASCNTIAALYSAIALEKLGCCFSCDSFSQTQLSYSFVKPLHLIRNHSSPLIFFISRTPSWPHNLLGLLYQLLLIDFENHARFPYRTRCRVELLFHVAVWALKISQKYSFVKPLHLIRNHSKTKLMGEGDHGTNYNVSRCGQWLSTRD